MFRALCLVVCLGATLNAGAQSVFINEIHYDNASTDTNEAIELAGPAGTDLSGWSLVLYNGNDGKAYDTKALAGVLTDQSGGHGFTVVNYPSNGIQNGAPDGIALVNAEGTVVQFLSYEGTLVAVGGPADGLTSTDIGVSEDGLGAADFSLQLVGSGSAYMDFAWAADAQSTFGTVNQSQSFGAGGGADPDPNPNPEQPEPAVTVAFINELHYDNVGTDSGEGVEIAGLAGTNLAGWQLVPYNGNNGAAYSALTLSGTIPAGPAGFGTIFFAIPNLQNGAPDGIALVNAQGQVLQFLSYEGTFTATDGPANGMTSTAIAVEEGSGTPEGYSLQLTGTGSAYSDFTWAPEATATYDAANHNQVFVPLQDIVFINELHYDNDGTDSAEGVEVAGNAGADLQGWRLVAYNGNGGAPYSSIDLQGVIPNQQNGYGTLFFLMPGLQNGAPDGIALVNAQDSVLQFLSYEGAFTAVGGPADGLTSTDVGVAEASTAPLNASLQLTGTGFMYADFTWSASASNTYGAINTSQSFGGGTTEPNPDPEPQQVSIAAARTLPAGTQVIINGTLTATAQLGGPAYLQDATGGIPLFDYQVHGPGNFSIGDSIQVTASIGQFNQQVQLTDVTDLQRFGAATNPITPAQISLSELGAHEGELVTVPGVTFTDTKGLLFPESNYKITDGTTTAELRIDGDVESLVGRVKPQREVTITGVVGSFRGTPQLQPRFIADLPGTTAYVAAGSDIPESTTLDVMNWNMEFFGSTIASYGPADVQLQLQNARRLIDSVDADVIAVQEISDENLLQQLVDMLPGYARICSERYSYSFDGPDPAFPPQKVCFLYKTDVIKVVDERVLFEAMYDSARAGYSTPLDNYPSGSPSSFWSSGRLPYMLTVDATVNGITERLNLINIHAKSGGASSDLQRKFFDVQALKDTLEQYYPNANLIMLGDYNDDVDESIGGGPSTFSTFVQADDFKVVTAALSEAGLRSYITQDNVIDHVTISNELFDNYLPGSARLVIPFNYISNYVNTTSDHLPVVTRYELAEPLVADAGASQLVYHGYAPASCATLTASATGGVPGYTYTWSTGQSGQTIQVCPEVSTVYTLTVTDTRGVAATSTVQVCVADVSCGSASNPKVQVYYNPSGKPGKGGTLCVSEEAVPTLLRLGATLGDGHVINCKGTPLPATGTTDLKAAVLSFMAYPNPISDYLNLVFDTISDGDVEVAFYNSLGTEVYRNIYQIKGGKLDLDVRNVKLNPGMNYLKVSSQSGSKTIRIYKN